MGKRCPSKSISEDAIYAAVCDVVKKVFLSNGRITTSIQKLIEKHMDLDGVDLKIEELEDMLTKLDKELDEITTKRSAAGDEIEIGILERQFRTRMKEYKDISSQIDSLRDKQKDAGYTKLRMGKIKDLLDKREITPDMITQPLLQALIQNIIVIDKQNIVVVLSDSDIHTNKEVSSRRHELVEKTPIVKGTVHIDRPFRPETLHYKVVMI